MAARQIQPPRRSGAGVACWRPPYLPVGVGHPEACESGRIGTIGNRVWRKSPWVQIPPSPLQKCCSECCRVSRRMGPPDP